MLGFLIDAAGVPASLLTIYLVLDDFEPSFSLSVYYPLKHKSVSLGNEIKPEKVSSKPVFEIYASAAGATRTLKTNSTFTLALTDPDATSRSDPVKAQMCHWVATNIIVPLSQRNPVEVVPDNAASMAWDNIDDNGIEEIMPYFPPAPPPKTGYHRYVFVLLALANDEDARRDLKKPTDRPHWGYGKVGAGVREWAEDNDLTVVGKWITTYSANVYYGIQPCFC